jgi:hypothetical protein
MKHMSVRPLNSGDLLASDQDSVRGWVGYTWNNPIFSPPQQYYFYRQRAFDGNNWSNYIVGMESIPADISIEPNSSSSSSSPTNGGYPLPINIRGGFLDGVQDLDFEVEINDISNVNAECFAAGTFQAATQTSTTNWLYWDGFQISAFPSPLPAIAQDVVYGWVGYIYQSAKPGQLYYVRYRPATAADSSSSSENSLSSDAYDWAGMVVRCRSLYDATVPINITGALLGDGVNNSSLELEVSTDPAFATSTIYPGGEFGVVGTWQYFDGSCFNDLTVAGLPLVGQNSVQGCVTFFCPVTPSVVYYVRHRFWNGSAWSGYGIQKFQA